MILIWSGAVLLALKLFAVGPFAEMSWWWTFSPLIVALVWFEVLEKPLGFDRRKVEHLETEARRKERVAAQFPAPMGTAKRK